MSYLRNTEIYTKHILDFFLGKGYISKLKKSKNGKRFVTTKEIFKQLTNSHRYICYLNKTQRIVDKECCEQFIKEHNRAIVKKVKFQYKNDKEVYPM